MGLISFSELIANLTADNFTSAEFAAAQGERATWGTQAWAEGWLIGTTVGTRANPNPHPNPEPKPKPKPNPKPKPKPKPNPNANPNPNPRWDVCKTDPSP